MTFYASSEEALANAFEAQQGGDWSSALEIWCTLIQLYGENFERLSGACHAALQIKLVEPAETMLRRLIDQWPNYEVSWYLYARGADIREDWPESHRRWQQACDRFPQDAGCLTGAGTAYMWAGDLDRADLLMRDALAINPQHEFANYHFATLAMKLHLWEEAGARWRAAELRFPNSPIPLMGRIDTLLESGQFSEAEELIASNTQDTNDVDLLVRSVQVAHRMRAWEMALSRLEQLRKIAPAHGAIQSLAGDLSWNIRLQAVDEGSDDYVRLLEERISGVGIVDVGLEESVESNALVRDFVSLGSNCEFGLVQRHFGAEPLGLLRWTTTHTQTLIRLLEESFNGLGDIDSLDLILDKRREWYANDLIFGVGFHTFILESEAGRQEVLQKQSVRIRFLRNQLLDMLEEDTLLVHKPEASASDEQLLRIAELLTTFGDAKILFALTADSDHPAGSLRVLKNNAVAGYLDRVWPSIVVNHEILPPHYESWLTICRAAKSQFEGGGN